MVLHWGFIHIQKVKLLMCLYSILVVHSDRIESLLQGADKDLQKSEICERQKNFVSALSYCTEAASECYPGFELATSLDWSPFSLYLFLY